MSFEAVPVYYSLPKDEEPAEVPAEVSYQGNNDSLTRPRSSGLRGGWAEILLTCAAISIPMMCLSWLLLALIFANRINPNQSLFKGEAAEAALPLLIDPGNAYLVDFSATQLITIASWASSVAPHLPAFLMTLSSYPLARKILLSSHQDGVHNLPTPYQLTILLELRNGSLKSLWTYLDYAFRKNRDKPPVALSQVAKTLMLATVISYLILAADTWLHVTTSTVTYVSASTYDPPLWSFGRGLPEICYQGDVICSMLDTGVAFYLSGSPESFRTLYNISELTRVSTFELDGQSYAYVADAMSVSDVNDDYGAQWDFSASSFAISTTCTPITTTCNPAKNASGCTPFQCSEAFQGNLGCENALFDSPTVNAFGLSLFFDEDLTSRMAYPDFAQEGILHNYSFNPFHIGTYATVSTNGGSSPLNLSSNVAHGVPGGDSWILSCSATVWNAAYISVNQTIIWADVSLANSTTAAIFAWPFYGNYGFDVLQRAAVLADFATSIQDVADQTALAISTTAMALVSGVLEPRQNILEQGRGGVTLVARIPKAPLFTLIVLNLLFAAVGVVCAVLAAFTRPNETREVQARLGIEGLVTAKFENENEGVGARLVKDFFAENRGAESSPRIGIVRTHEGVWKYQSWWAS